MRQQEMIRELVDYSITAALQDADNLREIFERGFPGFLNMPKNKLIKELQFRGILDYEDDDTVEEDESDEELMVMLSEMTGESAAYFD
ncbi:MAG: hypothetical protein ACREV0_00650 [Burkholderiales bacterium]